MKSVEPRSMPAKDGRRAYEFTLAPGVCAFLGNNFEGRVWAESSRWVGECQSYVAGAGGGGRRDLCGATRGFDLSVAGVVSLSNVLIATVVGDQKWAPLFRLRTCLR